MSAGAAAPVLSVRGLRVAFGPATTPGEVVHGIDLDVAAGECVALVGRSGSGKSVTARALLGLAGPRARVRAERMELAAPVWASRDLLGLTPRAWRRVRGAGIGLVLQDALVSLDPLRPVGREIDDALRLHTGLGPTARRERMLRALADAGIPDPEERAGQRAGELSGGLRQRALIAAAIALDPPLLIADEPTTALDVEVQRHVLATLGGLRSGGTALLLISHDLSLVARTADRVAVMEAGRIVESGPTGRVLEAPEHPYTRRLLAAVPGGAPRGTRLLRAEARPRAVDPATDAGPGRVPSVGGEDGRVPAGSPVLELDHVTRRFGSGAHERVAVDDVSLTVRAGRTLGLLGESGSGKTTTARIALGLTTPQAGSVTLFGRPWAPAPERERRPRRSMLGAVYQDALSSFDPRRTVGALLADALTGGRRRSTRGRQDRIADLLRSVGLDPDLMARHPATLSGGQRQRVAIARALAPGPAVLICDEPVSSLDVLVQAQVLDLLDELQERLGLGYLFISHDLGVVRHVSDEVAVMKDGRVVERGDPEQVFTAPRDAYARRLLTAAG